MLAEIRHEPISNLSEFRTRPYPVPDIGEAGIEPQHVFEESMDESFDRVANFEKDEGVDTPIVIV